MGDEVTIEKPCGIGLVRERLLKTGPMGHPRVHLP
jgi:hypothetical protein